MKNPLSYKFFKKNYLVLIAITFFSLWPTYSFSTTMLDKDVIKAIKKNDWNYIRQQIQNGFDINAHDADGYTLLHKAIGKQNSKEFISYLIENGVNINTETKNGYTPLLSALQVRDMVAFDILLKANANVTGSVNGNSALHYAAHDKENAIWTIPVLIQLGADVKIINGRKETPLHVLMKKYIPAKDYLTLLKLFIKHGTDLNQQNNSNETVLILALKRSTYMDVVELLLEQHVDVTLNSNDNSIITAAYAGGYINTPIFNRLVKMGAKVDDSGLNGVTLLHHLAKSWKDKTANNLLISDFVLRGSNPNVMDGKGNTPLMHAAEIGDLERVKLLISLGAKIGHRKPLGPSVLEKANWTKNKNVIIKYLLDQGADINAVRGGNSNLLIESMNYGEPEDLSWIKYLLDKGANPNIFQVRQSPRTPYDWAEHADNAELKKLLASYGAYTKKEADEKLEKIFRAIKIGQTKIVRQILDEGFFVDNHCPLIFASGHTSYCADKTPLMVAIQYKQNKIIELLLSRGASAVRPETLLLASASGDIKVVTSLFKHGAKVNLSALIISVKNNHIELSKILLKQGVVVEDKDQSSLYEAIKHGHVEMLKLLIANEGDVNWSGHDGISLLQMAYNILDREIIKVLEKNNAVIPSDIYLDPRSKKFKRSSKVAVDAIRYNDIRKVNKLISAGHEFNLKTPNMNSALNSAALLGNIQIIRLIEDNSDLRIGINNVIESVMRNTVIKNINKYTIDEINMTDMWGRSALYYSIVLKNREAFDVLINSGATTTSAKSSASPLLAAVGWSLDIVDIVLKRGNHTETQLSEALYKAVSDNYIDMAKHLLDEGAKPFFTKRNRRYSTIYIATKNKNTDMAMLLLKYDVDPTQGFSPRLFYISSIGYALVNNMDKLALDLIHYSNKNISNPKYGISKGLALTGGKYEHLDLMLIKDKSNLDKLLLEAASSYIQKGAVVLLKHGANPLAKDKSNKTVLDKLNERKMQISEYDDALLTEEIEKINSMIELINNSI
ncbi:MAG: ankyrin repeat domain-containing protein [Candidatus Thiodiazotropha sp. (ex Monitilora ramsayi)]|nr:ankyrin repeat domain-containing protein [Candidatus Thiodiazotropha sp. (ex Monitilora ramsayi)]